MIAAPILNWRLMFLPQKGRAAGWSARVTQTDLERIRSDWALAALAPDRLSAIFYARLFHIAPETRSLFPREMAEQRENLVDTLDFVVSQLSAPETMLPVVRDLAIRHVTYGVRPEHYPPVGEALIWTLERLLGPIFGDHSRRAWTEAYTLLADSMIEAAYPEEGAA